jgi:hypothetical protein
LGDSWLPIDKEIRSLLPKNRAYSEIEALISLQLDFDEKKPVSVAGYANLWGWSRDKVRRFLADRRVDIVYSEDTKSKQNQRGYLKKTDRKTDKRQIKKQIELIDINELKEKSNRSKNRKPTDTQVTTIYPINPNPKERKTHTRGESQSKEKDQQEKTKYGEYVFLFPAEHLALTEKLGAARLAELIEDVNLYCGRSGKSYKSYKAAILTFDKKDKQKNGDTQTEVRDKTESNRIKAKSEYEYWKKQGKSEEELSKIKASICQKYNLENSE